MPTGTANSPAAALEWSPQQLEALEQVRQWRSSHAKPTFYLAGYAGTGKTTLAQEIAQQFGGAVVYGAFTGKAASVMRSKGCEDAKTIDSLIYHQHREKYCTRKPPCGEEEKDLCGKERCQYRRSRLVGKELNPGSDVAGSDLVIIDEVSMVNDVMGSDLLSFGRPVLVLGDPAQLPPVSGGGYFTGHDPDYMLTEVHRQALESPVLSMATLARTGKLEDRYGERGGSAIVRSIAPKLMVDFDQIIVGRNSTRQRVNQQVRSLLGFTDPMPMEGDKVVCLKNNHRLDIQNGTLWTVVSSAPSSEPGFMDMTVENDDGHRAEVHSPCEGFTSITANGGGDLPEHPFAFGYAITCHKSQGSQWGSVLVFDESWLWRQDRWRWLYTAITRASERVTVVRPPVRRWR